MFQTAVRPEIPEAPRLFRPAAPFGTHEVCPGGVCLFRAVARSMMAERGTPGEPEHSARVSSRACAVRRPGPSVWRQTMMAAVPGSDQPPSAGRRRPHGWGLLQALHTGMTPIHQAFRNRARKVPAEVLCCLSRRLLRHLFTRGDFCSHRRPVIRTACAVARFLRDSRASEPADTP